MSKYYRAEDVVCKIAEQERFEAVLDSDNAPTVIEPYITEATAFLIDLPTIEVSEGVIGQGSGDFDLQAVVSTGQEIYAKGYEDGRKSVEASEDCISRAEALDEFKKDYDDIVDLMVAIEDLPSVVPSRAKGKWIADRYCSECEWDKKDADYTSGWKENYRPNCGSKMESEE